MVFVGRYDADREDCEHLASSVLPLSGTRFGFCERSSSEAALVLGIMNQPLQGGRAALHLLNFIPVLCQAGQPSPVDACPFAEVQYPRMILRLFATHVSGIESLRAYPIFAFEVQQLFLECMNVRENFVASHSSPPYFLTVLLELGVELPPEFLLSVRHGTIHQRAKRAEANCLRCFISWTEIGSCFFNFISLDRILAVACLGMTAFPTRCHVAWDGTTPRLGLSLWPTVHFRTPPSTPGRSQLPQFSLNPSHINNLASGTPLALTGRRPRGSYDHGP